MRYLSVCSGIEAASCAWHWLGWTPAGFAEIDDFPSAVLAHRYPNVENHGDFTRIAREPERIARIGHVDVLVGGTPCQSFSVAGLRGGLSDERGNLALEFFRLAAAIRPTWILWENVPGVLSSGGGRDFGAIIGAMGELRYGFAWRVLDAQHFGVPQRRRRIFLVGHSGGSSEHPATVLFEPESGGWHSSPRRKARQGAAVTARGGIEGGSGREVTFVPPQSPAVTSKWAKGSGGPAGDEAQNLVTVCLTVPLDLRNAHRNPEKHDAINRQGVGIGNPDDPAHTLSAGCVHGVAQVIGFHPTQDPISSAEVFPALGTTSNGMGVFTPGEINAPIAPCLDADMGQKWGNNQWVQQWREVMNYQAQTASAVRRLTPVECERLQGFPDNWTNVPYRGKPASDGPRYKAIGNSMAVPVMFWLGQRIQKVQHEGPFRENP